MSAPPIRSAVDWCRGQLDVADLALLAGFVATKAIDLGRRHRLLAYHGSPRSHTEDLLATTDPDTLDAALGHADATLFAGGHTHVQMLRQHRGRLVINAGSVGMPFREYAGGKRPTILPFAEYARLEVDDDDVHVELCRVHFDLESALAANRAWRHPIGEDLARTYEAARAAAG